MGTTITICKEGGKLMKKEVIKGTVVKVTETQIVLLTNEGLFKNIPKSSSEIPLIGEAYTCTENKMINKRWLQYSAMAAALFLLIFTSLSIPFGGSAEEAFIIAIDINPSIEVATDDQYQVIRAEGLNKDGENILETVKLENDLTDVIRQIMDATISSGYVQVDEALVATSVVALEKEPEEMIALLEDVIYISLEEHEIESEVMISNEKVELYEEAKEHNLSMNYYKEYKVLEASGIVKDKEEIKGKTLAELKRMENKSRKEQRKKSKDSNSREKELPSPVERSNSDKKERNQEKKAEKNKAEKHKTPHEVEKKSARPEKANDNSKKQQQNKGQGQGKGQGQTQGQSKGQGQGKASEQKANPNSNNAQPKERNVRNN